MDDEIGPAFVRAARHYLIDSYWPRLSVALQRMSDENLWWRPNEASNSVGNLVLHLCGNARQWLVSGVGGAPDVRRRQEEFDERGPLPRAQLVKTLDDTFRALDRTLESFEGAGTPERLLERRTIQGREVSLLEAILHVVEHVSHHTGQILWIAKARSGQDLGLWHVRDGIATPTWTTKR